VLGSGTVLDTSRLRGLLADRFGVAESSVHASIVGEHGDSEIALWSSATVGGVPLSQVHGLGAGPVDATEGAALLHEVRHAAAKVMEGKGCTNFAIGLATARIVRAVAGDEHAVLPVSVRTTVDGVGDVCLSLPSIVGRDGVLATLDPPLDAGERDGLRASAVAIRGALDGVL
jgi:L-lactate dehydrogenase